jgi:dimeric dUTPase (all-alpha-NTP-PPase superfamily)
MPLSSLNFKLEYEVKQQIIDAFKECMTLQNNFNKVVNPEWRKAGYNWRRAMWIESAELVDHLHYKWWKDTDKEPDHKQVLLEVVDIFHFYLSEILVDGRASANDLYSNFQWAERHVYAPTKELKIRQIEEFVVLCIEEENVNAAFFQVMCALNIDPLTLTSWYIGKNALNKFRQDNGYKDGTYRKQWNVGGEMIEDNVVLEQIINEANGIVTYENVIEQLDKRYV